MELEVQLELAEQMGYLPLVFLEFADMAAVRECHSVIVGADVVRVEVVEVFVAQNQVWIELAMTKYKFTT